MKAVYDPILGELRMQDEATTVVDSDGNAVATSGFEVVEVTELPETGESGKVYRVADPDGTEGNAYIEWYWTGSAWERIGADGSPLTWGAF